MANTLITPDIIAKEALIQLENNLVFGKNVHRDYKKEFAKVGDTVSIRRPVKFGVSDGATLVKQDVEEGKTSITVDQRKHVAWEFSTQDLTLKVEDYSERYIKPAMIALANKVDTFMAGKYAEIANRVGTPGTTPNGFDDVALVAQRMDEMSVPRDGMRKLVLNPAAGYKIAGTATALYMDKVAQSAYRSGAIGEIAGLDTYSSQNIQTHTTGTHGGTPLVNGASQDTTYALSKNTGTSVLNADGFSAGTELKAGDTFTIAGVYAVNPVPGEGSKPKLPYLREFTVVSDTSAGASQAITVKPAIIADGPYQTVSNAPADNAAITMVGASGTGYVQNMGFHKNAFALVTCPLAMPDGVAFKARRTWRGMSIRVLKDYDITNDVEIIRLDMLFGGRAIYPELAVRLDG